MSSQCVTSKTGPVPVVVREGEAAPKPDIADPEHQPAAAVTQPKWTRYLPPVFFLAVFLALLFLLVFLLIPSPMGITGSQPAREEPEDSDASNNPVVDLGYSRYAGTYLSNGVSQYLGIRYARPPTGDLRWRAPVEPEQTEGIQKAKEFGPVCLGLRDTAGNEVDEDCLTAYIWGPSNVTAETKLPVMVFIQGGGYTHNANANWNGSQLVEASGLNIVYISFNYRVGLWGFLAGEEVRKDGNLNAGLLDQRCLLQWVQKHIASFGGDPDHVVIQGLSAGSGSVALHMAAYGGRDDKLYAGSILQSTFLPAHPPVSELEWQFNHTAEQAGCQDAADRMNCLRSMSRDDLQKLNDASPFPGRASNPFYYWTPCLDGEFLQDHVTEMFAQGKFHKVPALLGTVTNEGSTFVPDVSSADQLVSSLVDNFPKLNSSHTDELITLYPKEDPLPLHDSYFPSLSRAYGEGTFICPTRTILNALCDSGDVATWSYRYNVEDNETVAEGFGVPHVSEAPAVWAPEMLPSRPKESYFTYNAGSVSLVMHYWLSFVRFLDPNVQRMDGAPVWHPWSGNQSRLVLQLPDPVMENVTQIERARCDFWQSIGPAINQR
ncbi:unnamed protein product [Clonostachys rhizophaga]|uniref:Carboxylic ester hydrolase n=1 Tax=Clonostachys rhizophaga TaxID=160324 RepID=A0A9N9YCL9_9HYPO|nr:unnamed protein product [Clonostachys rhizophaga]